MELNLKAGDIRKAIAMYLGILYKFHKLTDKEIEVLTEIIYTYKQLKDKYDSAVAEKLYLDKSARKDITDKFKMSRQVFRNYLVTFRKKGIISGDTLKAAFIPDFGNINLTFNIRYEGQDTREDNK